MVVYDRGEYSLVNNLIITKTKLERRNNVQFMINEKNENSWIGTSIYIS